MSQESTGEEQYLISFTASILFLFWCASLIIQNFVSSGVPSRKKAKLIKHQVPLDFYLD